MVCWTVYGNGYAVYGFSSEGNDRAVRFLLSIGARTGYTDEMGNTALHVAVRGGHLAAARSLIDAGADVDERSLGYDFDDELSPEHGETPLHIAAELGLETLAKSLLDAGADVDPLGGSYHRETPLGIATREDDLGLVVLLLKHGADPYRRNDSTWPYQVAENRKNDAILAAMDRALLERGIEPPTRRRSRDGGPEDGTWRVPLLWQRRERPDDQP